MVPLGSVEIEQDEKIIVAMLRNYQSLYSWDHSTNNSTTRIWDKLQDEGHCCGLDSPNDWDVFKPKSLPPTYYPGSCCRIESKHDDQNLYCTDREFVYSDGCRERVSVAIGFMVNIFCAVIISFLFFLGSITACIACRRPNIHQECKTLVKE